MENLGPVVIPLTYRLSLKGETYNLFRGEMIPIIPSTLFRGLYSREDGLPHDNSGTYGVRTHWIRREHRWLHFDIDRDFKSHYRDKVRNEFVPVDAYYKVLLEEVVNLATITGLVPLPDVADADTDTLRSMRQELDGTIVPLASIPPVPEPSQ